MKPNTEIKLKWGGWGLVAGALGAMIIGFYWGGWTTQGKTQQLTGAQGDQFLGAGGVH